MGNPRTIDQTTRLALPPDAQAQLRKLLRTTSLPRAARALGCSESTVASLYEDGRLRPSTHARILAALRRLEADGGAS